MHTQSVHTQRHTDIPARVELPLRRLNHLEDFRRLARLSHQQRVIVLFGVPRQLHFDLVVVAWRAVAAKRLCQVGHC
jgi:hypothetical protein